MLAFRPTALVLVLIGLSSCAYTPGGKGFPWGINFSGAICDDDSSQVLEGVDWYKAKVLNIRIRQGRFSPTYLGLYVSTPYILIIENADDVDHTFRANDFFRAIAVGGVSADEADFKEMKCIAGVTISPHTKTALRFVAVRDGTYEFEDDSLVNSLAMIGTGGGFITIEPQRRIIENTVQHTRFFDHKPVVIKSERIKKNELGSSGDAALVPDSLHKEMSKDLEKNSVIQQSSETENSEQQQPMNKTPTQPFAISPSDDQEHKPPVVPKIEPRKETVNGQKTEIKKAPVATTKKDLTQQVVPEAKPRGYQLFEGPPADVYSDPPDEEKIRTNSSGTDGDGGEDKLDNSG